MTNDPSRGVTLLTWAMLLSMTAVLAFGFVQAVMLK